jgi:hypothetical protein
MARLLIISIAIGSWLIGACERDGCELKQDSTSRTAHGSALSAYPNPVPAGDASQQLGSTVITWNTGNKTMGDLCVRINRERDKLVARAPSGTMKIDWIQFDSKYEFRLYGDKHHSKLLNKLVVGRED